MDFVYFKVLKTHKQGNFEKKELVPALCSTLLAPPQVSTLALSTGISVLTVLFCSCSLCCSVWCILRWCCILATAPVGEYVVTKQRLWSSKSRPRSNASANGCEMNFELHQIRHVSADRVNYDNQQKNRLL